MLNRLKCHPKSSFKGWGYLYIFIHSTTCEPEWCGTSNKLQTTSTM